MFGIDCSQLILRDAISHMLLCPFSLFPSRKNVYAGFSLSVAIVINHNKIFHLMSKWINKFAKLPVLNFCSFYFVCVSTSDTFAHLLEFSLHNQEFEWYHKFQSQKRPATALCYKTYTLICYILLQFYHNIYWTLREYLA